MFTKAGSNLWRWLFAQTAKVKVQRIQGLAQVVCDSVKKPLTQGGFVLQRRARGLFAR